MFFWILVILKKLNILLVCLEIVKSISIRKMFIFITEMNGKRTSGDKFIKMTLDLNCYIDMDEEWLATLLIEDTSSLVNVNIW